MSMTEDDFNRMVGKTIAHRRHMRGMTQEALSSKSGLAARTISGYERGVQGIRFYNAVRLAEAMNVSVSQIYRSDDPDGQE